jgi:hypothetical protein
MNTQRRARYDFSVEESVIAIIDHDEGVSVEEDAGNVLADIASIGIDLSKYSVVYRDAEMTWHGIRVRDGRFGGLFWIGVHSFFQALAEAHSGGV